MITGLLVIPVSGIGLTMLIPVAMTLIPVRVLLALAILIGGISVLIRVRVLLAISLLAVSLLAVSLLAVSLLAVSLLAVSLLAVSLLAVSLLAAVRLTVILLVRRAVLPLTRALFPTGRLRRPVVSTRSTLRGTVGRAL